MFQTTNQCLRVQHGSAPCFSPTVEAEGRSFDVPSQSLRTLQGGRAQVPNLLGGG